MDIADKTFLIDAETRVINIPDGEEHLGVEGDVGTGHKYFKCPRIVGDDGIDLNDHQIYISYVKTNTAKATRFVGDPALYHCNDVALDETGDYVTFSWEMSGDVFKTQGLIAFKVMAKKTDGESVKTCWNTRPAIGTVCMTVPDGIEGIAELYPDIITQLLDRMDAVEEIATVEAMQGYVDDYLGRNPVQLDSTLTDPEKAAPADVVGELRSDIDVVNTIATNGEAVYFYQEHPKSNYYTEKVNLKANQTYTIHVDSSRNCAVTIRDAYDNRTEIVNIWGGETKEFTPQTDITGLILWIDDAETPTLQTFIVKIYRGKIKDEIKKMEKTKNIYVEKDGTGDFTSLVDAVNYVNSNTSIKFTVYVGSGTYDLIEELGEEYFADYKGVGLVLNNNAHYIFSSNSKVVCNYVGDNENIKKYFSPFNCSTDGDHTGFILENLTLECANVRYAIHDEVNGQIAPFRNEYINCHITLDNSQNTQGYRQCIGGGLGCASEVIIKNCYFKSIGTSNTEIVTYHNVNSSSNDNYRSNVTIDSCYFADTNTCRCSYCGISEKISRMIVSNCSLGAEPRMIAETSSELVNFELIKWNNEIRS